MVNAEGSCKRPYETVSPGLTEEIALLLITQNSLTDRPIILEGAIEGYQADGGNEKLVEGNAVASAHRTNVPDKGTNVSDKGTSHTAE
ncbi:hypothetical protein Tco_0868480 [Tanacetum coccineum]